MQIVGSNGIRSVVCDGRVVLAETVYRCMACSEIHDTLEEIQRHHQLEHLQCENLTTVRSPYSSVRLDRFDEVDFEDDRMQYDQMSQASYEYEQPNNSFGSHPRFSKRSKMAKGDLNTKANHLIDLNDDLSKYSLEPKKSQKRLNDGNINANTLSASPSKTVTTPKVSPNNKPAQSLLANTSNGAVNHTPSETKLSLESNGDKKKHNLLKSTKDNGNACRECVGCLASDCGRCLYCLDKPEFGGNDLIRQKCLRRRCISPNEIL